MKKMHMSILAIVIIPVLAYVYAFAKLAPLYEKLNAQYVSESTRKFAAKIEAGELSNEDIAARLYAWAKGEDKIESGIQKIGSACILWFFVIGAIALLQAMLIDKLLKTHNNKFKRDAASGAP